MTKLLLYLQKYFRYNLKTSLLMILELTVGLFLLIYTFQSFNSYSAYRKTYNGELQNSLLMFAVDSNAKYTEEELLQDPDFNKLGLTSLGSAYDASNPSAPYYSISAINSVMAEKLHIPLSKGSGFSQNPQSTEAIISKKLSAYYRLGQSYDFIIDESVVSVTVVGVADSGNLMPLLQGNGYSSFFTADYDFVIAGGAAEESFGHSSRPSLGIVFDAVDQERYNQKNIYYYYTPVSELYDDYRSVAIADLYSYCFLSAIVTAVLLFGVGAMYLIDSEKRKALELVYDFSGRPPTLRLLAKLLIIIFNLIIPIAVNLMLYFFTSTFSEQIRSVYLSIAVICAIYLASVAAGALLSTKQDKPTQLKETVI